MSAETAIVEPVKSDIGLMEDLFDELKRVDSLAEQAKEIKKRIEVIENELLDRMESDGVSQIKDTRDRIVYLQTPKVRARINKADQDEAFKALRNWEEGEHIKESIAPATVSRIVTERLRGGLHVDDEVFQYYLEPGIGVRGKKK